VDFLPAEALAGDASVSGPEADWALEAAHENYLTGVLLGGFGGGADASSSEGEEEVVSGEEEEDSGSEEDEARLLELAEIRAELERLCDIPPPTPAQARAPPPGCHGEPPADPQASKGCHALERVPVLAPTHPRARRYAAHRPEYSCRVEELLLRNYGKEQAFLTKVSTALSDHNINEVQ
jgi:hypothetical protein